MICSRANSWLPYFAILLICGSMATPAFAQRLGQGAGVEIAWWRVASALLLCLALAVAGAYALRARLQGGRLLSPPKSMRTFSALTAAIRTGVSARPSATGRQLRLLESLRLSHQVDVCLLECDGKHIIIAATPQGAFVVNPPERSTSPSTS